MMLEEWEWVKRSKERRVVIDVLVRSGGLFDDLLVGGPNQRNFFVRRRRRAIRALIRRGYVVMSSRRSWRESTADRFYTVTDKLSILSDWLEERGIERLDVK